MKIERLRKVKKNFSKVIAAFPKTGPVIVTQNGKRDALLIAIDKNTDLEPLALSHSPQFWTLFDRAAAESRVSIDTLPSAEDDAAWELVGKNQAK